MARHALSAFLWVMLGVAAAFGQTTAFTYQGQLTDAGQPANGNFDLQFGLFDNASGGTLIGTAQTVPTVPVSGGVFTVQLDFGVNSFPGANRFLEIGVRPAGGGSFTTLVPRQQISSSPYAIRTLSAATADALSSTCVGCVRDSQINTLAGSKLTGTIPVASLPTGSGNYLQNTTTQQAGTNFNISGNGTIGGNLSVNGNSTVNNLTTNGSVGVATSIFLRSPSLQIGPGIDPAFTISPSDTTPNAGYIRFGDSTGWKLHFTRSREKSAGSGGTLNTGTTGALLTIQDNGKVGVGDTSPTFKLHVVDPANTGLRVQTNTGGGTVASFGGNGDFQVDAVNVVGGRLSVTQAGNAGIGTATPQAKLDVRGDVKLGSTGQFFAPGGEENLRIIRGRILGAGTVDAGFGSFTVSRDQNNVYTIKFTTPFSSDPSVTVTAIDFQTPKFARIGSVEPNLFQVIIFSDGNDFATSDFNFIAVGPR